jgi:hypothetical protein
MWVSIIFTLSLSVHDEDIYDKYGYDDRCLFYRPQSPI